MKSFSGKVREDWDLEKLLGGISKEDFESQSISIYEQHKSFARGWRGKDLSDTSLLLQSLCEYEELLESSSAGGPHLFYLTLKNQLNLEDSETKALLQKYETQNVKAVNETEFYLQALSRLNSDAQKDILINPKFKKYRHFFRRTFDTAKYLLSESEEKILNLTSQTSYSNWVAMLEEMLSKKQKLINLGRGGKTRAGLPILLSLLSSTEKINRDKAAREVNRILKEVLDVAVFELNSVLKSKQVHDELRKCESADTSRLISDDIESDVVEKLIGTVSGEFNFSRDYYSLKANLLGVEKLAFHERNVPYGETEIKFTFDECVDLIWGTLLDVNPKYAEFFKQLLEQGRIDVYPRRGKSGSQFCAFGGKKMGSFILLNFTGKLDDVLTLAHEFGHALNYELMSKNESPINAEIPTCTAEVSSIFFESLLLERITDKAKDKKQQLSLTVKALDSFVSSVHRQIACYMFEIELHSKFRSSGNLSQSEIGRIFIKNMRDYMGESVSYRRGSENWWVYWSHIRNYFYVYSYAFGYLTARAILEKIRNGSSVDILDKFLSEGSSRSPKEVFLNIGLDIEHSDFWKIGLRNFFELLALANKTYRSL